MGALLQWRTMVVMLTAATVAALSIAYKDLNFATYILFRAFYFGETLFHEMGHAIFFWLFGTVAVPSIMTLIGSDKAGGATMPFGHFEMVQLGAYVVMAYASYYCYRERPKLFYPVLAFCLVITVISFTSMKEWLPIYMGQGGSSAAASVLMYRAWLDVGVYSITERWLNAAYGFFILFHNAWFSYQLMGDTQERAHYVDAELTNDFVVLADRIGHWTLHGLGLFTLVFAVVILLGSFAVAAYFAEDEAYGVGF